MSLPYLILRKDSTLLLTKPCYVMVWFVTVGTAAVAAASTAIRISPLEAAKRATNALMSILTWDMDHNDRREQNEGLNIVDGEL